MFHVPVDDDTFLVIVSLLKLCNFSDQRVYVCICVYVVPRVFQKVYLYIRLDILLGHSESNNYAQKLFRMQLGGARASPDS